MHTELRGFFCRPRGTCNEVYTILVGLQLGLSLYGTGFVSLSELHILVCALEITGNYNKRSYNPQLFRSFGLSIMETLMEKLVLMDCCNEKIADVSRCSASKFFLT